MSFRTGYVSDRIRDHIRRSTNKGPCKHNFPILVVNVEGGKQARCLGCQALGPVRVNSEAARKALLVLEAQE